MKNWRNALLAARLGLAVALCFAAIQLAPVLNRWRAERAGQSTAPRKDPYLDWVDPSKGVKILMFYASPGTVARGEPVSLCYGVANAAAVKITPLEEEITPSFNRCLQVYPKKKTTYELTATGADGAVVSQALTVEALPRAAKAP